MTPPQRLRGNTEHGTLARSIPVQQHSQSQFAIPAGLETAVEFVGTQALMLQVGTLTDPIPVRPTSVTIMHVMLVTQRGLETAVMIVGAHVVIHDRAASHVADKYAPTA